MKTCAVPAVCIMTALAAFSVSSMGGCEQTHKATTGQGVSALVGEWTLDSIEGGDVGEKLPPGARRPSITIDAEGRVTGFGGVNRLSGSLDTAAAPRGEFKLGPLISTKMAGPPEAMELENRFMRLLDEAGTFELSGDSLVVWNEGKGPPMKLVRGAK